MYGSETVKYAIGLIKGKTSPGIYFTDLDYAKYICDKLNRDAGSTLWRVYRVTENNETIARAVNA